MIFVPFRDHRGPEAFHPGKEGEGLDHDIRERDETHERVWTTKRTKRAKSAKGVVAFREFRAFSWLSRSRGFSPGQGGVGFGPRYTRKRRKARKGLDHETHEKGERRGSVSCFSCLFVVSAVSEAFHPGKEGEGLDHDIRERDDTRKGWSRFVNFVPFRGYRGPKAFHPGQEIHCDRSSIREGLLLQAVVL